MRAQVAQSEDAFAVGDDYDTNIPVWPVPQQCRNTTPVVEGNEQAARASEIRPKDLQASPTVGV